MKLKKDSTALAKIQSNFENLLALEDEAFLLELREIDKRDKISTLSLKTVKN
jgi:hypothetical protein